MLPQKIPALIIIGIMLVLASIPASANTGRVMHMSGDVKINGKPMSKIRMVRGGDTISTGADSAVMVVMADKSVIDLQPNTRFKLEKFSFRREKPDQGGSIMNLLRGSFRYISGLIGRNNHANARIRMGTATAGIRGSFATMTFDGQNATAEVSNGTMTVNIGNQTMTVKAGQTGTMNQTGTHNVTTTGKGDVIAGAVSRMLDDPSKTMAEMSKLNALGQAMALALMVAEYPGNTNLSTVISTFVKSNPANAPFVASMIKAVAGTSTTADSLINSVKDTDGVNKNDVDDAVNQIDAIGSSTDDSQPTGDAVQGTSGTTISSGGGGVTSP